jgi:hypothetical protein
VSIFFTELCTSFDKDPKRQEIDPTTNKSFKVEGDSDKRAESLTRRIPPPLIRPACIKALTGVAEFVEAKSQL